MRGIECIFKLKYFFFACLWQIYQEQSDHKLRSTSLYTHRERKKEREGGREGRKERRRWKKGGSGREGVWVNRSIPLQRLTHPQASGKAGDWETDASICGPKAMWKQKSFLLKGLWSFSLSLIVLWHGGEFAFLKVFWFNIDHTYTFRVTSRLMLHQTSVHQSFLGVS